MAEQTYFVDDMEDEATHSLPRPKSENSMNARIFPNEWESFVYLGRPLLPVMAFLSTSTRGFTWTRCGPTTIIGVVN